VKRALKAALEVALPLAERFTGFHTAPGDYLRNRLKILAGTYEAEELALMRQFLKPGQVILDVGANVGYLTRFLGRATGPDGKVYAFEPNPLIFSLLSRNVAKLKQVSVFNFGLSSNAGAFPLFLAGNNHSVASFAKEYPAIHLVFQENVELSSIQAKVVIGDEFLDQEGIEQVDLIKIDVEGWEINALSGLEKTIAASKNLTIFCEYNPAAQKCAGHSGNELLSWLFDRQFTLAYPENGKLQTLPRDSIDQFQEKLGSGGYTTLFARKT
jgi:FkbM family methyltransferase